MIDGFEIFEPRGSPRGQGPPRMKSCIALWRCLPLEGKASRQPRRDGGGARRTHTESQPKYCINILLDEYLSASIFRGFLPRLQAKNDREKIGTRFGNFFSAFFQKKEGNARQCRIRVLQPEMAQGAPAATMDFMWKRRDPCALPKRKTRGRRGAVHRPARPAEHAVHRPPDARAAV